VLEDGTQGSKMLSIRRLSEALPDDAANHLLRIAEGEG
jgi:hypothetical protein